MNSKVWSARRARDSFEKMLLAAATDGEQIVELEDGSRYLITARVADPKKSAKEFLLRGGPLRDDEGFSG